MDSGLLANALTVDIELDAVTEGLVSGSPSAGSITLSTVAGSAVGVWEMTPGVATDTEVDEVFVVLRGEALVEFVDGSPALTLTAGSAGRFVAGTHTRWSVTKTLRKIYVVAEADN